MTDLSFDCADLASVLRCYTIGFGRFLKDAAQFQDVVPAGSGTLVTIGGVYGAVTARHVLKNLERDREVAIVSFSTGPYQQRTIDITQCELFSLPGSDGPLGPDLAFLRLPQISIETLKATNSFYPLDKPQQTVGSLRGLGMIDTVLGVVAEWSDDIEHTTKRRRKLFQLLFAGGRTEAEVREQEGYDLLTFRPTFEEIRAPTSFEGVSGGGLWRTFFKPDGSNEVVDRRLLGVAFYEEPTPSGLVLTCHGPQSIKEKLIPSVSAHWGYAAHRLS